MYVNVNVCTEKGIKTHTERNREKGKKTERETEIETEKEKEIETETEREREREGERKRERRKRKDRETGRENAHARTHVEDAVLFFFAHCDCRCVLPPSFVHLPGLAISFVVTLTWQLAHDLASSCVLAGSTPPWKSSSACKAAHTVK